MEFLILCFFIYMMNKVGLAVVVMLYLEQLLLSRAFQIYQNLIKNKKETVSEN